MADKLNIELFDNSECRFVQIGKLTNEVINFLKARCATTTNKIIDSLREDDIILWKDRIEYTEKHKGNFKTAEEYYKHIENIPNIIENPDYIGMPPHDNSIQYIKVVNEIVIVAVRVTNKGGASYRTLYPITESQLRDYLRKKRAWKYNKSIDT